MPFMVLGEPEAHEWLVPKRKPWERKFPAKLCFATLSPLHPVTEVRFRCVLIGASLETESGLLTFLAIPVSRPIVSRTIMQMAPLTQASHQIVRALQKPYVLVPKRKPWERHFWPKLCLGTTPSLPLKEKQRVRAEQVRNLWH
jgi:hypothetical protein